MTANGMQVDYYDISNVDGLAEANMYMIQATPSLVLVNSDEDEIAVWRGEVPSFEDLEAAVKNASVD